MPVLVVIPAFPVVAPRRYHRLHPRATAAAAMSLVWHPRAVSRYSAAMSAVGEWAGVQFAVQPPLVRAMA